MNAALIRPETIYEPERLQALDRYDVLDTPKERDFDDIAELASEICGVPIAVVNLIGAGRQFFKAEVGLGVRETPIETSFCGHALLQEEFMLVPDARLDSRFECNPLVTGAPGLRFYAGALLKTEEGHAIGTLCVLDYQPRALSDQQIHALKRLARQVMTQLELRRALKATDALNAELKARVADLVGQRDRMAMMGREIDHRVMNSLQFISGLLTMQSKAAANPDIAAQLDVAAIRVGTVARVHRHFYLDDAVETTCALEYAKRLTADLATVIEPAALTVEGRSTPIPTTLVMPLGLIVNELATNAAKHGARTIAIEIHPRDTGVQLVVSDDGPGLPADFDPGSRRGLGMRVVQALIAQHRGAFEFGPNGSSGARFGVHIG
jgi:two-component sensor histidine kinase